ncbi:MAG: hypothetical protein QXH08_03230 [Candidatus Hadarchaeales archaeon]
MRTGAVCDASVLCDLESFNLARKLFSWGDFYICSSTYSWLARDKLIEVRKRLLSYTLLSRLVRDGKLTVVYLPEILDEISRRLLFQADREIPLTDLRAAMLASHLKVPTITLDHEFISRLAESLGAINLIEVQLPSDGWVFRKLLRDYHELSFSLASSINSLLNNGGTLTEALKTVKMIEWKNNGGNSSMSVNFIAIDILDILRYYLQQKIFTPDAIQKLCENSLFCTVTGEVSSL